MQVDVFTNLDSLPKQVQTALSYRNGVGFFYSFEWFLCLANNGLGDDLTPRVYIATNEQGVQCALILAQIVGSRKLQSLTSFYTMEFRPIMVGDVANKGLEEIVEFLAAEKPAWHSIDLRYMRDGDTSRKALVSALEKAGFGCHAYYQYDNWYLDVNERTFETYYNALGSRLKNTIKRKGRKAERDHELEMQIYPVDDLLLDDAINDYNAIYSQSWKQLEPFPDFMPELFKTCDVLGIVRAGRAKIDSEPAAAQIWINDHGRAMIYKLAYDEKYSSVSIGSLLSKRLFENAIDVDKITEIDYGVGNEPYKRDWMSDVRTLGGELACNKKTFTGRLRHWRESLARKIKNK